MTKIIAIIILILSLDVVVLIPICLTLQKGKKFEEVLNAELDREQRLEKFRLDE